VTVDLAPAADARTRGDRDNCGVSAAPIDPIEEAAALASRALDGARRVLAGPDGPLALALTLALVEQPRRLAV
jgi:hypothetical protein